MFGIGFLVTSLFLLVTGGGCLSASGPRRGYATDQVSCSDLQFHAWCSSVGIETPLAKLETTPRSVAGRGVFASANITEGDVVIAIPEEIVLHEYNAAACFPTVARKLWNCRSRFDDELYGRPRRRRRFWRNLFSRHRQPKGKNVEMEFTHPSDFWQATLTSFSCACLEESNNQDPPFLWTPWISQWRRSDPMQSLFEKGVSWRDDEDVLACVEELSQMLPEASKIKLRAAVEMRLGRLEELRAIFQLDKDVSSMFGKITSRAMDLGEGVVGVLPMYDMINHCNEPNLALSFGDENFSLWALRDIEEGEELFVSYKCGDDERQEWDETDAIWMLMQWGIPMRKPSQGGEIGRAHV